jgi:hypothetical protein
LCPITEIIFDSTVDKPNYEEVQEFPNVQNSTTNTSLFLYVARGSPVNTNDNFIKTVSTGFNGFPCIDRTLKNLRNNNLQGKIDRPENYKGCGEHGDD